VASFDSATFSKKTSFDKSTFREKASFRFATFSGEVSFDSATFSGEVTFRLATFSKRALFNRPTFSGVASFEHATFSREITFRLATFSKKTFFDGATFSGETHFFTEPNGPSFEHECYFQALKVQKDAYVEFQNVNLSKASFLHTDLEKFVFYNVDWYEPKSGFRRNVALWDEFRKDWDKSEKSKEKAIPKSSYEQIAENYRQLVLNYDRKRDYAMAEQFHIGEMEVLRKKAGAEAKWPLIGWLRRGLNGYAIYRFSSHYGTSYWHASLMLLVLLGCFSWIFLFTGFQAVSEANVKPGVIEYDWGGSTPFPQWIADYGRSILLTLSIMTFQRERSYKSEGDLSEFWFVIATLVLTAQVALVLLAIRRRFKR
jgi:hypothetical protein